MISSRGVAGKTRLVQRDHIMAEPFIRMKRQPMGINIFPQFSRIGYGARLRAAQLNVEKKRGRRGSPALEPHKSSFCCVANGMPEPLAEAIAPL